MSYDTKPPAPYGAWIDAVLYADVATLESTGVATDTACEYARAELAALRDDHDARERYLRDARNAWAREAEVLRAERDALRERVAKLEIDAYDNAWIVLNNATYDSDWMDIDEIVAEIGHIIDNYANTDDDVDQLNYDAEIGALVRCNWTNLEATLKRAALQHTPPASGKEK